MEPVGHGDLDLRHRGAKIDAPEVARVVAGESFKRTHGRDLEQTAPGAHDDGFLGRDDAAADLALVAIEALRKPAEAERDRRRRDHDSDHPATQPARHQTDREISSFMISLVPP
jgi:hypothetical protein